ncbi:hypothetical protein [Sediminibacterium sp.]|uniref:hypothetical protein n=1 Tax=Sediminibacterium sp. TaxID=1917865 RepID=UPI0025DD00CA|nr:hypothetical protein [Sediminibacterium sp.]MBW0178184.1 hypothetical protein [Sediminibacterium sp.]
MATKIYKAFIASPSDTQHERDICDKVFSEINSGIGSIFNFRIESLKWENNVRPTIKDKDGQSVIFEQIGNEHQIFIGIMSKKFGSPTPRAGSGTEEEFNIAIERYKTKKDIEIVFYFNDEPPKTMSDINPEELLKVSAFKKQLQPLGIYGVYNGIADFEEKLRKHFSKYFISIFKDRGDDLDTQQLINKEVVKKIYKKRFDDSLKGFDEQPKVWIEPVISRTSEISQDPDDNYQQRVLIEEVLFSDKSYFINAPSQFGLSTLGHYLVLEAWNNDELWVYIDNAKIKPHKIENVIKDEVESLEQNINALKCIVFDSFLMKDKVSHRKLQKLIQANPTIRIIVLNTVDETLYLKTDDETDSSEVKIEKEFTQLHLIALPRNQVRSIVKQYNEQKRIEDENKVLNKVISELECLNLHRTPYNVLTILKVSEKYWDESPVNRTKMIEMILFVLFDLGEIPRYKTKPDLKDCEYVLGKYCELMLRRENYTFSKDDFIAELKKFCLEKYIDLEVEVVFEVLINNNIIISELERFKFKSSFWVYYFAAKRMHVDESFKNFILEKRKYTVFPEIIEFYTGVDRNRNDAVEILLNDIRATKQMVEERLGIKGNINPLKLAQWKPKEDELSKLQKEIADNVIPSNLPDSVKDQFLDKSYNQIRPYNQSIQNFFEEYHLYNLMGQISAASTALRNSDYANPELKKKLLKEIYESWNQLSKVLFALSPVMASQREATFGGATFELHGDFGSTFEIRLNRIIQVLPTNVVGYFKDDLYSPKIAPLLYDNFENEENDLLKHQQALLLIFKRPNGWKKQIENYINSTNKNSYYLFDIVNALRARYRYDFASAEELNDMKILIKLGIAKHEFGGDKSNYITKLSKIDNKVIPDREFNGDE